MSHVLVVVNNASHKAFVCFRTAGSADATRDERAGNSKGRETGEAPVAPEATASQASRRCSRHALPRFLTVAVILEVKGILNSTIVSTLGQNLSARRLGFYWLFLCGYA